MTDETTHKQKVFELFTALIVHDRIPTHTGADITAHLEMSAMLAHVAMERFEHVSAQAAANPQFLEQVRRAWAYINRPPIWEEPKSSKPAQQKVPAQTGQQRELLPSGAQF